MVSMSMISAGIVLSSFHDRSFFRFRWTNESAISIASYFREGGDATMGTPLSFDQVSEHLLTAQRCSTQGFANPSLTPVPCWCFPVPLPQGLPEPTEPRSADSPIHRDQATTFGTEAKCQMKVAITKIIKTTTAAIKLRGSLSLKSLKFNSPSIQSICCCQKNL